MPTRHPTPAQDAMPTTRGLNFYLEDRNLRWLCSTLMPRDVFERAEPHLIALGEAAGGVIDTLAADADRNPPVLRPYDERGRRIDEVVRHPAYRELERIAFSRFGLAAMSHRDGVLGWPGRVPHLVKYALVYLFAQSEFGLLCPVNVTDSTSRMLRLYGSPDLQARYLPKLTTTDFDDMWQGTQWMTEKTGGSDVGASTTVARPGADGTWRLWGDKWFCSNANADCALTLARPDGAPAGTKGLAMFLVPKSLPDGTKNAWTINRLKDKLGSRSMATGEVTYAGAVAWLVGKPDQGFKQMMEMVNVSRLANAIRAAAIMRRSLLESLVHARHRAAFGRAVTDLPLMRQNLLEMLLDTEAATTVVLNAAAVFDGWDTGSAEDRKLFRLLTPLAKYWTTMRARWVASEGMNVRGGNGYVEEWPNARLVRDSYLGAIWEGTSNVVALDVQRAVTKDGCLAPFAGLVSRRLATVSERGAKPWVDVVLQALEAVEQQVARWPNASKPERDLESRPVADTLYHLLASSLLFAEGQTLREQSDDCRKLLVAILYARRWLRPPDTANVPPFSAGELDWVPSLVDWDPVPAAALPAAPPAR
jgi:alkylation response protein AidB-like acyl-CoA dehydrogenase